MKWLKLSLKINISWTRDQKNLIKTKDISETETDARQFIFFASLYCMKLEGTLDVLHSSDFPKILTLIKERAFVKPGVMTHLTWS